ncbi:MAG: hypothetical protein IJJ23_01290 [Clostridia bacterium]|nr:hypothetical protein [Clostridia bacterium]
MKRKLWIILALAGLMALLCCAAALADSGGTCGDNVSWTLNTSTITRTENWMYGSNAFRPSGMYR